METSDEPDSDVVNEDEGQEQAEPEDNIDPEADMWSASDSEGLSYGDLEGDLEGDQVYCPFL